MNGDLQVEASGFNNPNVSYYPKHGEGASIATCRFCYGDEDADLISPCMCKGSQQYVHRSCLDYWRSVKRGLNFSHCSTCKARFHLRVVELEDNELLENSRRKIKFRLNVARDVCLVFLALQSVIGMMGVVAYLVDKNGFLRNLFNGDWERILLRHPIPFYYYMGVLAFFGGLLGFVLPLTLIIHSFPSRHTLKGLSLLMFPFVDKDGKGCTPTDRVVRYAIIGIANSFIIFAVIIWKIWERHCHILPKRELSKEYVVEDLSGCYTPAKLDPQHMECLMLKLETS